MSWEQIRRMGITVRPFDDPPASGERTSPFTGGLGDTLEILARELRELEAATIVLQVGFRDRDLRLDGLPRADARMVHDAVGLAFVSPHGPLKYVTNEFVAASYRRQSFGWSANLRAIALGLEALRKVDRYGISKRGEQYTGWRALPQSTDAVQNMTLDEARAFIADRYAGDVVTALKLTHPDRGGDANEFRKVQRARELIAAAGE